MPQLCAWEISDDQKVKKTNFLAGKRAELASTADAGGDEAGAE